MIYTVTLNPAIDCAMDIADYCNGKVNRADSQSFTAGGKGINMSVILHRLGIKTKALGFCGGDTGNLLCRLLDRMDCPHQFTELDGQLTRINVKLHVKNDETEINGKGPEISEEVLRDFIDMLENTVNDGDTLILAGSVPNSVPSDVYANIMKCFIKKDVRIIADTSGNLLVKLLEMKPFLIKPNNFELGEICGCEINTRPEALRGAEKVQKMGAQNVLVSLAGEGAVLLCSDGRNFETNAPIGKVKNSVGAGDSMVAGFLAGLEIFDDYKTALLLALAAGSATTFSDFLAEKDEIAELFYTLSPENKNSLK